MSFHVRLASEDEDFEWGFRGITSRVSRDGREGRRERRYHEKRYDSHQRVDHLRIIFRALGGNKKGGRVGNLVPLYQFDAPACQTRVKPERVEAGQFTVA